MKKIYIINYTVAGSDAAIIEKIKSLGEWFYYFPHSFILLSSNNAKIIYDRIATNQSSDRFLVLEVDLKDYFGWMPKEAWEWLQKKKGEQGKYPTSI